MDEKINNITPVVSEAKAFAPNPYVEDWLKEQGRQRQANIRAMPSIVPSKAQDSKQARGDHATRTHCLVVNGSNNAGPSLSSQTISFATRWKPIRDRGATLEGSEPLATNSASYLGRLTDVTASRDMDMHQSTTSSVTAGRLVNPEPSRSSSDNSAKFYRMLPKSEQTKQEEHERARLESPIRSFEHMGYTESPLRRIEESHGPVESTPTALRPKAPPSPQGGLPMQLTKMHNDIDPRLTRVIRDFDEIHQRIKTALARGGVSAADDAALAAHLDRVERILTAQEQRSIILADARMREQRRAFDTNLQRTAAALRRHTTAELTARVGARTTDAERSRRRARAGEMVERKKYKIAERDGRRKAELLEEEKKKRRRQMMVLGGDDGGDDDYGALLAQMGTPRLRGIVERATRELESRRERGDQTRGDSGDEMAGVESEFCLVDLDDPEKGL
ncbi:hypothetical protein F5X99DRAFT_198544 [Biscogniauxia marginata]|nr:hypothetical protein F5X99DRAFT_198544 [Biscogniauxia marginata]